MDILAQQNMFIKPLQRINKNAKFGIQCKNVELSHRQFVEYKVVNEQKVNVSKSKDT